MISLREIEDTIRDLENGSATYNNCMKLASLYIIRDEMMKKEGMYTYGYNTYGRNYPMMYERGGSNGNNGRSSNSYAYGPMMYHNDDDLMIRKDDMYNQRG